MDRRQKQKKGSGLNSNRAKRGRQRARERKRTKELDKLSKQATEEEETAANPVPDRAADQKDSSRVCYEVELVTVR